MQNQQDKNRSNRTDDNTDRNANGAIGSSDKSSQSASRQEGNESSSRTRSAGARYLFGQLPDEARRLWSQVTKELESQTQSHPYRMLGIALGAGILIGLRGTAGRTVLLGIAARLMQPLLQPLTHAATSEAQSAS